jgi:hypothetical protein
MPPSHEHFEEGLGLFNRAHFFDAHEVLEDVWNSVPRDHILRVHLQGMVQLAVAFHHQSTGNHVGAGSVLDRALRNLDGADNSFPGIDLERLRSDLAPWQRYLDACGNVRENDRENASDAGDDQRGNSGKVRAPKPLMLPKIMLRPQIPGDHIAHRLGLLKFIV